MILDDDFLIRFSLRKILANDSVSVTVAANGQEALDQLACGVFTVCCLDVHLPDISGIEIMRRIKKSSPDTRIIIMTAGILTDEMIREIRDNAILLSKPFDLSTIKTLVDRLVKGYCPVSG